MNKMKMLRGGVLAALVALFVGILCLSPVFADEAHAAIVDSGTLSDSVSWSLDDSGNLTIYPTNGVSGSCSLESDLDGEWPWDMNTDVLTATVSPGVTVTDHTSCMFNGCSSLTTVDLSGLDTSSVTDMGDMFSGCSSLTTLNLSGLDTSSVTNMGGMFSGCSSLTTLDLSGLDTSSVTNMASMFVDCTSLTTLDLSGDFDTSSVENMSGMFNGCSSLGDVAMAGAISNLNTSSVTDMTYMFANCSNLTTLDLSGLDTSSVTDMGGMFTGTSALSSVSLGNGFSFVPVTQERIAEINASKNDIPNWGLSEEEAAEELAFLDNLLRGGALLEAPTAAPYTGKWTNGTISYTATELAANYNSSLAGTWVWEQAAPAPSYPTIPMTLTLDASKATNTTGMTFTFNPAAEPVVAEEEGAFAVPRYDSNDNGAIDEGDDYVAPSATTLTALAMSGDTQDIEGALALPDPSLYGHAGVYAYVVTQQIPQDTGSWDYSEASYKVRVYVKNGANGLEYAETPIKIEALTDDAGDPVAKEQGSGYGPKVQRMLFTNMNTATTNLEIAKTVTGAYGNRSKAFPFTLTVTLPSWAADGSFVVTTTGSDLSGTTTANNSTVVTTSNGAATITFKLAHGQSLSVAGLPVGTTFSTGETDSTDGVNTYTPTATYFYDGNGAAGTDYADNTQNYSADLDSNSQPTDSITVYASAASAAANAATMLGEGSGNLVTVTNDLSNPPSPTGVAIKLMPYILMALVGCGIFVVMRSRKREDDLA